MKKNTLYNIIKLLISVQMMIGCILIGNQTAVASVPIFNIFKQTGEQMATLVFTSFTYNIVNRGSGKYLNVLATTNSIRPGTNVCASNNDGSLEQKFALSSLGNNKYLIKSKINVNYVLDIATDSSPKNGMNVQVWSNSAYGSKHWYLDKLDSGYFVIRSVLNQNMVLATVSNDARANVVVQSYNPLNDLQQWKLEKANVATQEEAVDWLKSQVGKSIVNPVDGLFAGQCASFATAYYKRILGTAVYTNQGGTGHGYQFSDDNHSINLGWSRFSKGNTTLQAGDIIVSNPGVGGADPTYGHVMMYIGGGQIVHQAPKSTKGIVAVSNMPSDYSYVIRPSFR
ncbi:MAG: RICIN domain-containing protein [Coriobacteriia bacterium]|nr:RICIN domain-containing protein [Coriobacteriia bacterium]